MTDPSVARGGQWESSSEAIRGVEPLEGRCLMAVDAVLEWNDVLLDAVRAGRTPPPYAARNMAIVQTAVYDAVWRVDGGSEFPGRRDASRRRAEAETVAVARAAHDTLVALYPDRRAVFDAALASTLAGVPDGPAEDKGEAAGRKAARQVLKDRRDDGADATVPYTPGTGPADWQPTPAAFAPALLPGWGDVTPFALKRGAQFRPPPPPKLTSAEFTRAFARVKALGSATGSTRTPEQTQIALFWADGAGTVTPPGHWNQIAAQIGMQQGNTLPENARMFAVLDVALADAGIAAWDAKYTFNYVRPVTAIRNAAADDGNPNTVADPTWSPLLATPPFPSYVSGHSTFSAAAAVALAGFFGTDHLTFTTGSDALPGVTRTFTSLWSAAEEAGVSRIYGGIHWDFDNTAGLALGRAVGEYVVKRLLGCRDGHDADAGPSDVAASAHRLAILNDGPDAGAGGIGDDARRGADA
jgi:membrane-associated phospholipid phosphatase